MKEKMIVTAIYGKKKYTGTASPYIKTMHSEQYGDCKREIHKQLKNDGKYEVRDSLTYTCDIVKE